MDFRQVDILDLDATREACEGVDYVLHQAAIPSVPKSVLDPLGSNRANADGTLNVLVAARDAKVKRVVSVKLPTGRVLICQPLRLIKSPDVPLTSSTNSSCVLSRRPS